MLNIFASIVEKRENLPPTISKLKDAWIYLKTSVADPLGETIEELHILRCNPKGHILEHTSGAADSPNSYQALFEIAEDTKIFVAFSRTEKPLRLKDFEFQLREHVCKENLRASLAAIGPIFVPPGGDKKKVKVLALSEIRDIREAFPFEGTELTFIAHYPLPWDGNPRREIQAAQNGDWHPGTASFREVARTPNQGDNRTEIENVRRFEDVIRHIRFIRPGRARDDHSIGRINIITHANPDLIGLSGRLQEGEIWMDSGAQDSDGNWDRGGIDDSVLDWLNTSGKSVRSQIRSKLNSNAEILLFLCNGGLGDMVEKISTCFNMRVLAYRDEVGYQVTFNGNRITTRNLTNYRGSDFEPGFPYAVDTPDAVPQGRHVLPDRIIHKPDEPTN